MRTALSQFSFALIILKIFTSEFYAIGALFAAYGAAILLVAIFRRYEGNSQFFDREESDSDSGTDEDDEGITMGQRSLDGHSGTLARESRRRVSIRKKFRYGPPSFLPCDPFWHVSTRPSNTYPEHSLCYDLGDMSALGFCPMWEFSTNQNRRTSGKTVSLLTLLSLLAYITLLVLTLRL